MSDIVQFVLAILAVVVVWGLYSLRTVSLKEYFSSRTGLGILKGIVLAICFAVALAVIPKAFAEEPVWFKEAEVFAGLDYTQRTSPQCVVGSVDDRTTSNLGLRLNVYEYENFTINSKYTHHSCAFGEDDAGYDAFGIELTYKFWNR